MDFAGHLLGLEVCCRDLRGSQQQRGMPVDFDAVILFGPGELAVVGAQASFHVSHGDACGGSCTGPAKRAGRVTLHDDQVWRVPDAGPKRPRDSFDMFARIRPARTIEEKRGEFVKPKRLCVERMLSGEYQRRGQASGCQSVSDWR